MHINKLLARNAEIAPGAVELMIHQVADAFHISMDTYTQMKKFLLLIPCISIHSSGMNAINIKKVSGDTGQAA